MYTQYDCVYSSFVLLGRSTESLEHSDNDSAEALKAGSRSPSASPQVIVTLSPVLTFDLCVA